MAVSENCPNRVLKNILKFWGFHDELKIQQVCNWSQRFNNELVDPL